MYLINKEAFLQRLISFSLKRSGATITLLLLLKFSAAPFCSAAAQEKKAVADKMPLPVITCNFIDDEITLSGKVDDPAWKKAEIVFLNDPIDGKPGRFATKVRVLYNTMYLYVSFECEDNFVWGTLTEHDASIFTEECVEMFLCPSGKMRQYYELNVSPLNTVFDTFILNGRQTNGERSNMKSWTDFTCDGMLTKVNIKGERGVKGATGWTAEYAIPFSSILGSDNLTPMTSETWKVNFYRIDTPEPKKMEFYSWSPTGANDYHRPWRFGFLKFVKP